MAPVPAPKLPSCPVTGYSLVNALGTTTTDVLDAIAAGRSGLSPCTLGLPFETHVGQIQGALPALPAALAPFDARVARIAWAALEPLLPAVRDAVARRGRERVAVLIGSSTGGIAESERAFVAHARDGSLPPGYSFVRHHAFDGLVRMIVAATGATGPAYAVSAACASSAKVLGAAQRLLASGMADVALVGGADSLCQTTLRGFGGLKVLSASPCRPFDAERGGISIGEGAGFVLLERGAPATVHLLSVGETSDAHHMTAPHPEGRGAILAMTEALEGAAVSPPSVGYVNAHGTGTESNDAAEGRAIAAVLGPDVPVSSTKGMTGHLLGAAGITEAVICLDVLHRGRMPPNAGLSRADPDVGVCLVKEPAQRSVEIALSNSFAFGGCNVSALFGVRATAFQAPPEGRVRVRGAALWEGRGDPPALLLSPRARGRASLLTRLVAEITGQLASASGGGVDVARIPIVLGSASGEMGTTLSLLAALAGGEPLLSPLRFPGSVHNAALGTLSIQTGNQSFSTALAAGARTPAMALVEACAFLRTRKGEALVVLAEEGSPAPLFDGAFHAPLAYGFWLSAGDAGEGVDPAMALGIRPGRGDAAAPGSLGSRYPGHPLEGGLSLLEHVMTGTPGTGSLVAAAADGWCFDLGLPGGP